MILLDTCSLLWLADKDGYFSKSAIRAIKKEGDILAVSAISALEIVLLFRKKRLVLPEQPEKWFDDVIEMYKIHSISVTAKIAARSANLPFIHKDPCDRIIIATAMEHNIKIITPDKIIKQYPEIKVVW